MFTLQVRKLFRKTLLFWSSTPQQPKRLPTRLGIEALEDRSLLSVSSLPVVSSQAESPLAVATSSLFALVEQRVQQFTTIVQYASNVVNTLNWEIVQEVAALQLQVGRILGFDTTTPTPSSNAAVLQHSSESVAGQAHASGFGSGSATTTTAHDNPHPRLEKAVPLTDSGVGSGSPSGPYSGSATVTGWVWLDNNADGSQDQSNLEMDYSGATVDLLKSTDNGASWSFCTSTTTSSVLQGYNYSLQTGFPVPNSWLYKIQVIFPSYFAATTPSAQSKIDAQGYSSVFALPPGAMQVIPAGLVSMNVNTTADDPNGPLQQNTVTLRDAMLTGNSLKPFPAVTFYTNPQNGQQLSGSIGLQQALPSIQKSYNITGPGSATLTVNGNNNAGTIFTVNAGVGSTISGLTITGGAGANGGGVYNQGNLTLTDIILKNNQTAGNGGGIAIALGGKLYLEGVTLENNTATQKGGGLYNSGTATMNSTTFTLNKASMGGGIYNYGSVIIQSVSYNDVEIDDNTATGQGGGGVYNWGKFQMDGGTISNNHATAVGPGVGNGGGIYQRIQQMTLTSVAIEGNDAAIGRQGGGIFVRTGTLTLNSDTISQNVAGVGGGLYENVGTVKMVKGAVSNNNATITGAGAGVQNGGGGIFAGGGSLTLTNVPIKNNGSRLNGGGIDIAGSATPSVKITAGSIANNTAWNSGGGIYTMNGSLTLTGQGAVNNVLPVSVNSVANQGGGLYLATGSTTTFNGVGVTGNTANGAANGMGIYWQSVNGVGAIVNPNLPNPAALTDNDDPNGDPVKGP